MIKVLKSDTVPESLCKTKAYDGEDVRRQLLSDQFGKCYLCERLLSTDFQIEHLKSRENYPELAQQWDNLLLSCSYCNLKKSSRYDDILNPSCVDVENRIKQEIDFSSQCAVFTPLDGDAATLKTAELLSMLYNGSSSGLGMKKLKEEVFFNEVMAELNAFMKHLLDYIKFHSDECASIVRDDLKIDRECLGFKYWVIKSNSKLAEVFAEDIIWNK